MPLREINLIVHFLGLGIFVTLLVSGPIIESQYRRATDIQTKALLLRTARSMRFLGPIGILIMLLTGIGNMYALGIGLLDFGWLTGKIIFFAMAATNGVVFGIRSMKRGMLVQQMASGEAPADAETRLKEYNRQTTLFYFINSILILIIVTLGVYGRLGGQ